MIFSIKFYLILSLIIIVVNNVNTYKLNVPKVLLPFHSSKLISFVLEAKSENNEANEDFCFTWSSSRPDIVSITPIYDNNDAKKARNKNEFGNANECSTKALVSAVSKHAQRLTSIILAKEIKTDKLIRCDVIVDKIDSIRIKHTTTHLYLEDSPECFTVEALDTEGNTFTSLDGLPFEWSILNDPSLIENNQNLSSIDSRNVLRLSKFIESEYVVSDSIKQLETIGLSGNKILIEGLKTGTANVQSKLLDSYYKDMKTPMVRLLVVANILVEPSHPVYLLVGATVKYNLFLIKQTSIDKINLPSLQYYFDSRNKTVTDLSPIDQTHSTYIGLNIGSTDIVLIDRNMKEELFIDMPEARVVVPPPTVPLHVVSPNYLVFVIKNWRSSWVLEVGRTYEIMVFAYTDKRQQIYPSDNLKIESEFDLKKFRPIEQSTNGSYHRLQVLEKGSTQARAFLKGTIALDNSLIPFELIARGEQDIELLDPIRITPNILIFAYIPTGSNQQQQLFFSNGNQPNQATSNAYEYQLIASGGSGSYHWQSRNTTIISVNNQGLVRTTATKIGRTNIIVTDTRNIDIESNSTVYVLEPIDLQLQACPVETQLGSKLYLNVQMNARLDSSSNLVPISDCSRLSFEVIIKDEDIFKFVSINSPSFDNPAENSCAVIVLDALKVGSTTIKINTISSSQQTIVQLNSNELKISSYSQLKSFKNQLVLAKCSSAIVHLFDGPLSSSKSIESLENRVVESSSSLYVKTFTSDNSDVEVESLNQDFISNKFSYVVKCNKNSLVNFETNKIEFANVKFQISHKKTSTNKCPLTFEYEIKVRCTQPHSLQLSQLFVNNNDESPISNVNDQLFTNTASHLKWKCPIKLTSNIVTAHFDRPLNIQLLVRDNLNNIFDNFTYLPIEWQCDGKKLVERSTKFPKIRSIEIANLPEDSSSLIIPAENDDILNTNRLFYQIFDTKGKHGDTKLNAILHLNKESKLSCLINIKLVSEVKIQPEVLTIFNHPSNVVPLSLMHGSGHFNAEIEQIKTQEQQSSSNVLKINQLNEHSVIVSPLTHSGLANLNIFDYCIPPLIPLQTFLNGQPEKRYQIYWPPTATSKIQVTGINSIMVNYEDDKVEIGKKLKIYVQISDATGNLIKTNYFSLMGLTYKLTNNIQQNSETSSTSSIQLENKEINSDSSLLSLASIDTLNFDEQISPEDREYTAVFVLNAIRIGTVMIQFEAKSDGYIDRAHHDKSKDFSKLIRSTYKDIQIYSPLRVEPKYIELIRGAYYQVSTTGGPNSPEASIKYELVESTKSDEYKNVIQVNSDGVVDALKIGQVKVLVKSVGMTCVSNPTSKSSGFGCSSENKKEIIYSQDYFVVKVVELKSIHIQTPIKSIKRGNEMPIYLMANDLNLSPLNFASCPHLKYIWKVSDVHVASLHHPLLLTSDQNSTSISSNNYEELFENSVSLRFSARKSGHVKISVRIEFLNNYNGDTKLIISDSIDLFVFEEAYFTHLPLSYYSFKYPKIASSKLLDEQTKTNFNEILMSPGSQFQVKTNLDNQALKINYELKYYNDKLEDQFLNNKFCNNNSITVNTEGMVNVAWLDQHELKNLQHCTVNLLVTLFIPNEPSKVQQQSKNIYNKQQTLSFTIKVKPVVYSMIKLNKNGLLKTSDLSINKLHIDRKSLIKNKLILDDVGIQMKWHVRYYDNLGDVFDVISLENRYRLNRNDLVDFSQMNNIIFTLNQDDFIEKNKQENKVSSFKHHLSLMANSYENSFLIKTIKQGRFVMELTPYASNLLQSRDYLSLLMDNFSEGHQNLKSKANIGYITCLNGESLSEEDESSDQTAEWLSQSSNIIKLIPSNSFPDLDFSYTHFGVCMNEGSTILKRQIKNAGEDSQESFTKAIEINVDKIEKVKFFAHSINYVSNSITESDNSLKMIQFEIGNQNINQNCSEEFEKIFISRQKLNIPSLVNEIVPFKCYAAFYTQSGKRLSYLDRLMVTSIIYSRNHWSCDIKFVENSHSKLYELIDSNVDRPNDGNSFIKQENEPTFVRVHVDIKSTSDDDDFNNNFDRFNIPNKYIQLKFIPAFHVETKLIEMPVIRKQIGKKNTDLLDDDNLSDQSDHFNLIIHSTHQLRSHLILTTNCPSLIQIKPMYTDEKSSKSNSILTITYDVHTNEDTFDIATFASLMQQQNGQLYVQIACSLTQQIERVPIKFIFGSDVRFDFKKSRQKGFLSSLFCCLFDYQANQIISALSIVVLTMLTILFILRLKSPSQQVAEQIALNVSSVAAAAVGANSYRNSPSVLDRSSFNPYTYFESNVDGNTSRNYRTESRLNTSNYSPSRYSPGLNKSQEDQFASSPRRILTQNSPLRSPNPAQNQLSPNEANRVQLFSVQSNVQPRQYFNTSSSFSVGLNSMNLFNDNSDSESQVTDRRVPPRN